MNRRQLLAAAVVAPVAAKLPTPDEMIQVTTVLGPDQVAVFNYFPEQWRFMNSAPGDYIFFAGSRKR